MENVQTERIIGKYTGTEGGPLVIAVGGMHGNEPAGILGLERVFARLEELKPNFYGTLVGIRGNLQALEDEGRFVERDLNRVWTAENLERIEAASMAELTAPEDIEQKQLLETFENELFGRHKSVLFIDLHTTSAADGVFSIASEDQVSRDIAMSMKVPLMIGLDELIESTALNYFLQKGVPAIALEAGQHYDVESVSNVEAALWVLLEARGCIDYGIKGIEGDHAHLESITTDRPNIIQFVYRHHIVPEDGFKMEPGFANFQEVSKGQLLGYDNNGPVTSHIDGLILMPLYQGQGEDGYFLVKEVG